MSYSTSSSSSLSSDETGKVDFSNFIDLQNKVLGNYHLIHLLGKGSYAQVWLAYNHVKDNFYALKIQHPDDFNSAKEEVKLLKRIENVPNKINVEDNFIFAIGKNQEKYYVIVFPIYGDNLEDLLKLDIFENGLKEKYVEKFVKQSLDSLKVLHNKYHYIHCDIKPDNFLLSEPNYKIKKIMSSYNKEKFKAVYQEFIKKNPKVKNDTLTRETLHKQLVSEIDFEEILTNTIPEEEIYQQLEKSDFLLSDFGSFCHIDEKYDEDFGTRYYRSPENILVSEELSYATDIWSLGCTIYELLTNRYLFDPIKCKQYSTDHHHLSEIFQLGKFSNKEIKSFQRKKEFFHKNKTLKSLPQAPSIESKFKRITNEKWVKLIKKMLVVSFKKRPLKF